MVIPIPYNDLLLKNPVELYCKNMFTLSSEYTSQSLRSNKFISFLTKQSCEYSETCIVFEHP